MPSQDHPAQNIKMGKRVGKAPTSVARWAPEVQRTKRTLKTQQGALDASSEDLADPDPELPQNGPAFP